MIEPRTGILYKAWMDANHSPVSSGSRDSYISYLNPRAEFVLSVMRG